MTKNILVVDDEPGVLYTVKQGLETLDKDYTVVCVNSGAQALETLQKFQLPDLIILDLMMPSMNGWEVYKAIRQNQNWKDIPIVFLTARTDDFAKSAGIKLGNDYIEKPFELEDLKRRIDLVMKG